MHILNRAHRKAPTNLGHIEASQGGIGGRIPAHRGHLDSKLPLDIGPDTTNTTLEETMGPQVKHDKAGERKHLPLSSAMESRVPGGEGRSSHTTNHGVRALKKPEGLILGTSMSWHREPSRHSARAMTVFGTTGSPYRPTVLKHVQMVGHRALLWNIMEYGSIK